VTNDHRTGLLMAISGFALFSIGDTVTKSMAGEWSPIAVAALRFVIGTVALGGMLAVSEGRKAFIPYSPLLQLARGASLGMATIGFFTALFVMPLAVAVSIAFAAPAFAALLSGPLLGEKVRRATWMALPIAFAGVLIVLRPNLLELGWAALLPLLTALGMSLLVITNRASAGHGSSLSMQFFLAAGTAVVLLVAAVIGELSGIDMLRLFVPDWTVVLRCAFVAVTGTAGHWLIFLGTTKAGASSIAPTTYIQLITAPALGWLAFGNRIDFATLVGALVIMGAGLLLWWDGRALESVQER